MCGIVGYVGAQNAADVLIDALTSLEYRGYDSAGMALLGGEGLRVIKTKGRLQNLVEQYGKAGRPSACCGIGHTRWATHGEPSDVNSHPHFTEKVALVHNGIIENYVQLREELTAQGYAFTSQTDTETAAKLVDALYQGDPWAAIAEAMQKLEGSYAFGVLFADHPGTLFAVRKDSPLIVGLGGQENFIASDVPAILPYTRDYHLLEEGEIAAVTKDSVVIRDPAGRRVTKQRLTADWEVAQAQKDGYPHFMLKEIHEQPKALTDTIHPRIVNGMPDFAADGLPDAFFSACQKIYVVACGTAMHAGVVGKASLERLARIPTEVDLASEFRYRDPIFLPGTLVVAISQSGETADTLAALRLAKSQGADTLAIVNVMGSSIAREADHVLYTYAGPEIAVASTKAFSVQIEVLYLLALRFALAKNQLEHSKVKNLTAALAATIGQVQTVLAHSGLLQALSRNFVDAKSLFYIGRGTDYALAMEGSLKMKEVSYIQSEAYAAGELKHGTISLITKGVPVVGLVTQTDLLAKIISNIKEVRARGGHVLLITRDDFDIDRDAYDDIIRLPHVSDYFLPLLSVVVLQLFAYYVAVERGCDVDKPRNLAKSVTVE